MAHPYYHAKSSAKKWGGIPEDYIDIHEWFDQSKEMYPDFRHRALRHHSEGIYLCQKLFGEVWTIKSTGREVPTRYIGEQHVKEDLGRIPSIQDWFENIVPRDWMHPGGKLDVEIADLSNINQPNEKKGE